MNEIYIIYARKRQLKFAMFLSVWWLWCLSFFIVNVFRIIVGDTFNGLLGGVINFICLIMATLWIEGLLNEND